MPDPEVPNHGLVATDVNDTNDIPIDPVLLVIPGLTTLTAQNQQVLANTVEHLQGKQNMTVSNIFLYSPS